MTIIFDLDGTLYQTQYSILSALSNLFKELEIPMLHEDKICCHIGKTTNDFLRLVLPDNIDIEKTKKCFRRLEYQAISEVGRLYFGVKEMLDQLKREKHRLYICSNGSEEYIKLVLNSMGISTYFDGIKSAKNYPSKSEALASLLDKNDDAIFIGDTIIDFVAAEKNKIPSIGFNCGYGSNEDFMKATFTADSTEEIYNRITQIDVYYKTKKRTIKKNSNSIIGINGVDTSGKTSFASNFSRFLHSLGIKNTILHIDDYHNTSEIRYNGENEIEAYYNNAFNYTQLIDEVLLPLKENGEIDKSVCCLNLDTDKYENHIRYSIDSETILLIEGVLLFRDPIASYFDSKIYIHIDFDEVIRRAKLRDVPKYGEAFLKKYENKYIPIQKKYLAEYIPLENSDVIIYNQDYSKPKICS